MGDIIWLKKKNQGRGRVCFIGETSFAEGKWVGLELVDVPGEHDGQVKGKRYFRCAKGRGVFVKPSEIDTPTTHISHEDEKLSLENSQSLSLRNLKKEVSYYQQMDVAATLGIDHEWELSSESDAVPEVSQQRPPGIQI